MTLQTSLLVLSMGMFLLAGCGGEVAEAPPMPPVAPDAAGGESPGEEETDGKKRTRLELLHDLEEKFSDLKDMDDLYRTLEDALEAFGFAEGEDSGIVISAWPRALDSSDGRPAWGEPLELERNEETGGWGLTGLDESLSPLTAYRGGLAVTVVGTVTRLPQAGADGEVETAEREFPGRMLPGEIEDLLEASIEKARRKRNQGDFAAALDALRWIPDVPYSYVENEMTARRADGRVSVEEIQEELRQLARTLESFDLLPEIELEGIVAGTTGTFREILVRVRQFQGQGFYETTRQQQALEEAEALDDLLDRIGNDVLGQNGDAWVEVRRLRGSYEPLFDMLLADEDGTQSPYLALWAELMELEAKRREANRDMNLFLQNFSGEQLMASMEQMQYQHLTQHMQADGRQTGMSFKTSGAEEATFRFNPNQVQASTLCVSENASDPGCAGGLEMTYAYDLPPQRLYNERPFTGNKGYVLTSLVGDEDAAGFASVGVWDDLFSDLSEDPAMTNSWAYYGHWVVVPTSGSVPRQGGAVTGPIVQMGSFAGIEHLGLDAQGQGQAFFSPPLPESDQLMVFQGDTQGLYASGSTSADVAFGQFSARARLEYRQDLQGSRMSGSIQDFQYEPFLGGAPALSTGRLHAATPPGAGEGLETGAWSFADEVELSEARVGPAGVAEGSVAGFLYQGQVQARGFDRAAQSDGMPLFEVDPVFDADGRETGAYRYRYDEQGQRIPVWGTGEAKILAGPEPPGQWSAGVFVLDVPQSLVPRSPNEKNSFAIGVWHAGWDWIAYGGNRGTMTGSFLAGRHDDTGVAPRPSAD